MIYHFTQNQKAAIVALLLEMANVDEDLAYEELIVTNGIWARIGVDEETFNLGKVLKYEYAVNVVEPMDEPSKIYVAKLLAEVVDADNVVDQKELDLLKKICLDIDVVYMFADGEES